MAIIFDQRGQPIDSDNPFPVNISGSTLQEQLTEADEVGGDLTFSAAPAYIEIVNTDASNAGVFTVNGVAITVPAEVIFGPASVQGTASAVVSVTGSTSYIVSRYS